MLLIRKSVKRWFFSLNTNNLAFTVLRSTASLFFHTLYSWIVNQSPIALTYLLPHCKGYERGELTFWRQMRHYRSFQMVKRPQTGTIRNAFNHTSLKWHELLILQRKKGPKYFCQIFSSNVLGSPSLLGSFPKSWEYCNAVKVSCLKWETACRFSTTVVSNVHNSKSSR